MLDGERIAIGCYGMRDRSWGRRTERHYSRMGYTWAGAADTSFLAYSRPAGASDDVYAGYLRRGRDLAHLIAGRRDVRRDPGNAWVTGIELEIRDESGRALGATGEAVSRMILPGATSVCVNTLMRWVVGGQTVWGEDQDVWPASLRAPMTDLADARTALPRHITEWIARSAGCRVVRAERRPGGGRREAWVVDVAAADGTPEPLFLRYDRSDPRVTGDPFTLHREARFYLALQDSAVPVPRVLGVHDTEQAILSELVAGQTWFSRLHDEEARLAVARDFMGILAALHRLDPATLTLPGETQPADSREAAEREIAVWEQLYRFGGSPADPMIEFGLHWLRRNVPSATGPVVIVQGDTGPGNFLYAGGHVTAVLDWELGHWGDPMDDLGWLALRAVQEPFTRLADRLRDWERHTGWQVDIDRVRYYRAFASYVS